MTCPGFHEQSNYPWAGRSPIATRSESAYKPGITVQSNGVTFKVSTNTDEPRVKGSGNERSRNVIQYLLEVVRNPPAEGCPRIRRLGCQSERLHCLGYENDICAVLLGHHPGEVFHRNPITCQKERV